uniref:Serpentine receptor class gamma n=1 Tax=Meloidogyne hapla TaxID=6305 RepID=A0A1I8BEM1_MELHA
MDTSTTQNNQTELIVLSPFTYSLLNIFSTNVAIPHIFAAIVGIPSALLYIFELIILYKHWSKFKSSFFVLFFFRAIISLINLFLSYLNQRFLKFGFFVSVYQQMPTLLLATLYFFIYYPFHVENIISVFLIINRLTSIVFPIKYGKIWTKSRMLAVIIFSCVAPLAFTYHIFQYTVYVKMIYSDNYILAYSDKTHGDAVITWYTVSSPLKPYFDSETFNLTNFAVQNQSPWVNDISTIVLPAWFMLWANGRLKQAIFRVLFNIKINILHLVGLNTLIKPVAIVDSSQLACFKQKTIYVQKFDVNARRNMISSSQPVDRNHRNQQPRYII